MDSDVVSFILLILGVGIGYNLHVLALARLKARKAPADPPRRQ